MPQPVNQQSPLTTVSGKFYVGMKREEAVRNDTADSIFSRDFDDIDKDGNGVLSAAEICDERDRECNKEDNLRTAGDVAMATGMVGLGDAWMGGPWALVVGMVSSAVLAAGQFASGMADTQDEVNQQRDITSRYRQQHGL